MRVSTLSRYDIVSDIRRFFLHKVTKNLIELQRFAIVYSLQGRSFLLTSKVAYLPSCLRTMLLIHFIEFGTYYENMKNPNS